MVKTRTPAAESDEGLVTQCLKGDQSAFAELVDRYKHRIHWLVRRMVGSAEDEDLTQEVFIRVYKALPGFRTDSRFSTWIFKIARNVCLSELRKRGRRGEQLSLEEEGEEKVHWLLRETQEGLESKIERLDLSQKVQELIAELPVESRTALTLYYVNQVSYEEIAEIMEIPLGTVKTYLHRAKLRLRAMILAESELAELVGGRRTQPSQREAGEHELL